MRIELTQVCLTQAPTRQRLLGVDDELLVCMNSDVGSQVEVQGKSFATPFECALKWFLSRVYQLVPLQFAALHKGFAAFGAHVHARPVCVKVLPHGGVISVTKKLSIIYLL